MLASLVTGQQTQFIRSIHLVSAIGDPRLYDK